LFLASGLRLSGLRNLNQSNLFEMEVDGVDRLFIRVVEKRSKERIIPIPDVMRLVIMVYLNHPDYKRVNAINEKGEKILFINTKNTRVSEADHYGEKRRLSVRYIEQMIKKRGKALGIPPEQLKPHAIRHLYGTELAEAGVDLHKIQLLMGHANLSTTLQYIHLAQRGLFRTVNESSPLAMINTPFHDLHKKMQQK
jgi:site-specific recombinase XerD